MNIDKCVKTVNKCIAVLNKEELDEEELTLIFSQLLIRVGKSLYDPEDKMGPSIDWLELNKKYYISDGKDIGLGLMLNGGQMMGVIDEKHLIQNGDKKDGKIPASTKNTQKSSRITVQPTAPKRRGRPRKHKD